MKTIRSSSIDARPKGKRSQFTGPEREPQNLNSTPAPAVVLIVEDSLIIRDRLVSMICDAGISVKLVMAENGVAARRHFAEQQPAVVLLDIALPDVGGLELLREFKQQQTETVVAVLTTYAFPEFRRSAQKLGADYFLNKAVEFERVCEVLRKHLPVRPVLPGPQGGEA